MLIGQILNTETCLIYQKYKHLHSRHLFIVKSLNIVQYVDYKHLIKHCTMYNI